MLLVEVIRAVWALRHDRGFVSLSVLLLLAVIAGSVFYALVEHLSPLDAAYFSVTSVTTVGYGDVSPETAAGKIFTSVFIVLGMGILVAVLSLIARQVHRQSVLSRPLDSLARRRGAAVDAGANGLRDVRAAATLPAAGEYDVLVIGADDAGHRTALEAARLGLRVVVVADSSAISPTRIPDLRPTVESR
jgi:hypothetical protein